MQTRARRTCALGTFRDRFFSPLPRAHPVQLVARLREGDERCTAQLFVVERHDPGDADDAAVIEAPFVG